MDANVSPGTMAMAQTIASMYLKVSLKNFRIGFMATSAADRPVQPDESIDHQHAPSSRFARTAPPPLF
jgi:hypothetical protein